MLNRIFLLFLLLFLETGIVKAESTQKIATLTRVTFISTKLVEITKSRLALVNQGKTVSDTTLKADIEHLLKNEGDPDVLARVATISLLHMNPGLAEDQVIDNVFDEAWRSCIRRIESIGGQTAINALENIQRPRPLDGGFSLLLTESLQRLTAKTN